MAERRHGGRRGDARGGGRGGGRGDLPNEEAARQRDLRDIENDDLRQQVRDLQRDIENGDLRQQVRDLQRRLARLDERRGKSNPMRSNASERRSMDDPLFSDVFTSSDADEPSKNSNSNIFSMPVYDTPVYDEDIFYELPEQPNNSNTNILSMPVYDKPVYDEDILSMPVYDKPVYDEDILSVPVYDKPVCDEDIFNELPGVMSKSPPPSVKFDHAAEDEGMDVDDDEEYDEEIFNNAAVDEDNTQASANDEQQLGRVKEWIGSYHLETVDLTDDVLSNSPDILVVLIEDIMDKLVKETFVTKVAGVSCVITTKKNFNYEFDAVKYEVDVQVGFGISDLDAVKEFGFVGQEFDEYPKRMMHDIQNWNWFAEEEVRDGEDDDDDGDKVDSRTSLFQEGEYDAVIEDKTWRLSKLYFRFYLFPS